VTGAVTDAWAAGFFDADGCVRIGKQRRRREGRTVYALRAIVAQSADECPETLLALQSEFGGSLSSSPDRRRGNRKPKWEWLLASRKAERFLRRIFPYVVGKREQVRLALEYRERAMGPGKDDLRERYYQRISALKNYHRRAA